MTKARQDATIKKIERNLRKLIPEMADPDFLVDWYEDQMGENIRDLESEPEENGDGNQRPALNEETRGQNRTNNSRGKRSAGETRTRRCPNKH